MQSPLANPDSDAYKKSANTRLWKIDRATGKVLGEYVYVMDDAASFAADNKKEPQKQNAVRMSEMVAIGNDKLLIDERISKTTKFYVDRPRHGDAARCQSFDDEKTSPSLEQMSAADLEAKGIKPAGEDAGPRLGRRRRPAEEDRGRGGDEPHRNDRVQRLRTSASRATPTRRCEVTFGSPVLQ